MLEYDWENSVGYWVCMTSAAMRRALNSELAAQNITLRQWEVLACIVLEGELSQADVADRLGIEAPTLVGILDRMERDGWIERFGCPDDRRRKRIRTTEKSIAVWNRMADCAHRVRAQAIRGFTPNELEELKLMCERLRNNLALDSGDISPVETCSEPGVTVRVS